MLLHCWSGGGDSWGDRDLDFAERIVDKVEAMEDGIAAVFTIVEDGFGDSAPIGFTSQFSNSPSPYCEELIIKGEAKFSRGKEKRPINIRPHGKNGNEDGDEWDNNAKDWPNRIIQNFPFGVVGHGGGERGGWDSGLVGLNSCWAWWAEMILVMVKLGTRPARGHTLPIQEDGFSNCTGCCFLT